MNRAQSEALHARVRAFVAASERGPVDERVFDALACDIARAQAEHCAAHARLYDAVSVDAKELLFADDIPAVPTDAFKLARIATHPPEDDARVFRTSGTTAGVRGEHALRTTETYDAIALAFGRKMLVPDGGEFRVLVLSPPPDEMSDSSLVHMCALFGEAFGDGATWLAPGGVVATDQLARGFAEAKKADQRVLLLGTSFAFVHLLDEVGERVLAAPAGTRVMQTGGFKGRSREVEKEALRAQIARALAVDERVVVAEYGMTELASQAYTTSLREHLGLDEPRGPFVYAPAPTMRVTAVDPETLAPLPRGRQGLARIVDLGNVDSAVAVQTMDLVREVPGGFELDGRAPGAPPRGCSLAIDELAGRGR